MSTIRRFIAIGFAGTPLRQPFNIDASQRFDAMCTTERQVQFLRATGERHCDLELNKDCGIKHTYPVSTTSAISKSHQSKPRQDGIVSNVTSNRCSILLHPRRVFRHVHIIFTVESLSDNMDYTNGVSTQCKLDLCLNSCKTNIVKTVKLPRTRSKLHRSRTNERQ